jgi:hypothetical protein
MAWISVLGLFSTIVAAVYWFGRWILGPIDRAAAARRAPARFSIGDFLCLFVVVQLPLTLVSRLQSEETEGFFWLFTILAWVIAPLTWTVCALSLSRAGIVHGRYRLVFMGLVLPIVYYGLIPFVALPAIALVMLLSGAAAEQFGPWWLIAIWVLTGTALIASGWYTNWLVQKTSVDMAISGDAVKSPLE